MNRVAASGLKVVRTGAAAVRPAGGFGRPAGARSHGDAATAEKDMGTWKTISIVGAGVLVGLSAYMYTYVLGKHHEFDPEKNAFPHMKKRTRQFPWSCGDCSLFDQACWDACKGRATAGHGHH